MKSAIYFQLVQLILKVVLEKFVICNFNYILFAIYQMEKSKLHIAYSAFDSAQKV